MEVEAQDGDAFRVYVERAKMKEWNGVLEISGVCVRRFLRTGV